MEDYWSSAGIYLRNRLRVIITLTLKIDANFLKKSLKFNVISNEILISCNIFDTLYGLHDQSK